MIKALRNIRAHLLEKWFIKNPRLRSRVTRLIYGNKDVEINLFGTTLEVNSLRENGYLRAYRLARNSSLWRDEMSTLLALFSILRPGDTFVDVGANVGLFSSTVSRLPNVRVLAFEAHPDTYSRLARNAARHGAKATQVAVSDEPGELEFLDGAVSHVFAAASHQNAYHIGKTGIKVKARTLDEMLPRDRPLIMKVDVEGHEPEVLKGAGELMKSGLIHAVLLDASPGSESLQAASLLRQSQFTILDASTLREASAHTAVFLALSKDGLVRLGKAGTADPKL